MKCTADLPVMVWWGCMGIGLHPSVSLGAFFVVRHGRELIGE